MQFELVIAVSKELPWPPTGVRRWPKPNLAPNLGHAENSTQNSEPTPGLAQPR